MHLHSHARHTFRRSDQGYALLTLLLVMALAMIFAGAMVSSIAFDIKRDREEEMIHRGVQYSRAIRAYYKKLGRYPTKLEDLESTSNMRFLRKRYKDPITGKDFKLLHFGDPGVKLTLGGGLNGNTINGASPVNGSPFGTQPPGQQLQQPGGINPGATFLNPANGPNGTQTAAGGNNANNPTGTNSNTPAEANQNPDATTVSPAPGQQQADAGDASTPVTNGGGAILGVASTSKKETIREFDHKKKYNEWQFIYDPATDRGGLIMGPNQPQLQGFGQQNLNGQGVNGQNNGIGAAPAAQPFGVQNTPTQQPAGSGPGSPPNDPGNPPPQQ